MIEVVPEYDDWISCNEQMPEVGQEVFVESAQVGLVTHISVGHYDGEKWICPWIPKVEIVKWRPFPHKEVS